jgi:(S)-mandelate dehydrogenase
VPVAVNIDDMRLLAKRRLPKIAFDFIEGGCDGELGITRNEDAFSKYALVPRYMADMENRSQATAVFGRTWSGPVGIAPTGLAALFRPGADMMLARAARKADVPFIMSGSSTASIEELGRVAPEHGWYQIYTAKDRKISEDMVRRVKAAGLKVLVVTVDVPTNSKRERNQRNGFTRPLRMTIKTKAEALLHPEWMADYMKAGMPRFPNWEPYGPPNATAEQLAEFVASQTPVSVTWKDIENYRTMWDGKLVLKGVMHPDDARRAEAIGVDGLMVSNHGGRQLDRSPSPIETLPAIVDAVGDKMTVMLDSGIRRGSDVLIAYCLGAKYVFTGRATLYAAAAMGEPGVDRAFEIFRDEIERCMMHMGTPTMQSLGPQCLMWNEPDDLLRNRRP